MAKHRTAKLVTNYSHWYPDVGTASPEQAAVENVHHTKLYRVETRLQELLEEDDERMLRDAFECSQLKLEVNDNSVSEDQLDQAVRDAESDLRSEFRSALENAIDDAKQDGTSLDDLKELLLKRFDH